MIRRGFFLILAAVLLVVPVGVSTALADSVKSRGWAHRDFGRVVFDWPSPVNYRLERSGQRTVIRFERPIKSDLTELRKNLAPYLRTASLGKDGRSVVLETKRQGTVRAFRNDKSVVIDIVPGEASNDSGKKAERVPIRTGKHAKYGRVVFDWPRRVGYRVNKSGSKAVIRFDRSARIDIAKLKSGLPAPIGGVAFQAQPKSSEIAFDIPANARIRHFRDRSRVVFDVVKPDPAAIPPTSSKKPSDQKPVTETVNRQPAAGPKLGTGAPVALLPQKPEGRWVMAPVSRKARSSSSKPKRQTSKKPNPGGMKEGWAPLISSSVTEQGDGFQVRFDWRHKTASAIFQRDRVLWIYFDRPGRLDLGALRIKSSDAVSGIGQVDVPQGSLLSIELRRDLDVQASRDGTAWLLRFRPAGSGPKATDVFQVGAATPDGQPSQLRIDISDFGTPFRFRDPGSGNLIDIMPSYRANKGTIAARKLVDLTIYKSAQGIAFHRVSDGLGVYRVPSGLVIARPSGVLAARPEDVKTVAEARREEDPDGGLGDVITDRTPVSDRHAFIKETSKLPAKKRNRRRLVLARKYLSEGLAADALGALRVAAGTDPSLQRELSYRALMGAARYLLGHFGEAAEAFNDPALQRNPDTAPWLAALSAERGDWKNADRLFRTGDLALPKLPDSVRTRFTLMAAEAALTANDTKRTKRYLDSLRFGRMSQQHQEYQQYLRGFLTKKLGDTDGAVEIWDGLEEARSRQARAKAMFARTETLLETKEINVPEAIDRLEDLSFAWRGGVFEFDLLRRLGDLYEKNQQYRQSLQRRRDAVSQFEGVAGAQKVTEEMTRLFRWLYLEQGANRLDPVVALAIYEEFRELTPPGEKGDLLVRRLADRLVKVDLLAEASDLLEHQVKFRLKGGKKADIAIRLAKIRLLDKKPLLAFKATTAGEDDEASEDQRQTLRLLRARSLVEMNRGKEAIELVQDISTPEASEIRLDSLWQDKQWKKVARLLRGLVPRVRSSDDGKPKKQLEALDAQHVLRLAIAYAMMGNELGLRGLKEDYTAVMGKGARADAFRAVVGGSETDAKTFRKLVAQASDIKVFQTFMGSLRASLKEPKDALLN